MEPSTIGLLALIYFMLYTSFVWLILYVDKKDELFKDPKAKKSMWATIIIPVYQGDSKEMIEKAVQSCLEVDYPKKKIMLAWNGPKTELYKTCKEYEKNGVASVVYTPKQGKAAGMNEALKHVETEAFCCLDGDSFFHSDALKNMVGYFEDDKVGAVTSSMKAYNVKNIVEKIQWVEYVFAIYLRKLASLLNALYVIPGPGGMYKTEIVKKLGGFDEKNLTEDLEIALRLQSEGYNIKNSLNAFVDTVVPVKLWELIQQRIRWYAGFLYNTFRYRKLFLNPKSGVLGVFMLPASIIWIVIVLWAFQMVMSNVAEMILTSFRTLRIMEYDLMFFISTMFERFSFEPTFIAWFSVILILMGFVVIYLGLKMSREKADFFHKYPGYLAYLLAYSLLMGVFWIFTLGYMITGKTRKMKW